MRPCRPKRPQPLDRQHPILSPQRHSFHHRQGDGQMGGRGIHLIPPSPRPRARTLPPSKPTLTRIFQSHRNATSTVTWVILLLENGPPASLSVSTWLLILGITAHPNPFTDKGWLHARKPDGFSPATQIISARSIPSSDYNTIPFHD